MKKIYAVALIATLTASAFAFDPDESVKLNGTAKSYTKTLYTVTEKFGEYFRSPIAKYQHLYDSASGQELEVMELNARDAMVDKITYDYDSANNVVASAYYDADGNLSVKTAIAYTAEGKSEKSEFDKEDNLIGKTIYKYKDNTVEESYYDGEGVLLWRNISVKDSKGNIVSTSKYFSSGALNERYVPAYNEKNELIGYERYNALGGLIEKVVYRMNADGLRSEEIIYNSENVVTVRKLWRYDEKQNPSRITTYNVSDKFGATVNELVSIIEFSYLY